MPPLMLLVLLGFGTVIVLALLLWSLLVPTSRRPAPSRPPPRSRAPRVSNDEVRGARAPATERPRPDREDAFERFLRAGRGDDPL